MEDKFKQLKKVVKYISAILHESHFPHLHRRLTRDDVLNLNRLRKMFYDIVASNKEYLYKIREDSSIFICKEVIRFLNEGELPDLAYEELFKIVEAIYENGQLESLIAIRNDIKKLDTEKYLDLLNYWKIRDERMYYVLNIVLNIENINKVVEYIEKLKEHDVDYLKKFLSKLDKNTIRSISGAYE